MGFLHIARVGRRWKMWQEQRSKLHPQAHATSGIGSLVTSFRSYWRENVSTQPLSVLQIRRCLSDGGALRPRYWVRMQELARQRIAGEQP
jgi:hypothetical protein